MEVYRISHMHEEVFTTKRETALEALQRGARVDRLELRADQVWNAHWLRACKSCDGLDEVPLEKVNIVQFYTSSYGTLLVPVGVSLKDKHAIALQCTFNLIKGKEYVHVTT